MVNVGAGTGSYEPQDRFVVAIEPSVVMISQRPADAAPVVQASARGLPLRNESVDAAPRFYEREGWIRDISIQPVATDLTHLIRYRKNRA